MPTQKIEDDDLNKRRFTDPCTDPDHNVPHVMCEDEFLRRELQFELEPRISRQNAVTIPK